MTQLRTMSSLKSVFKNRHNTVKVRQNAFLEYTGRFYRLGNRALSLDNYSCIYESTPTSPGCAIGQHVPKKCGLYGLLASVRDDIVWSKLPSWMRGLDQTFLETTQTLHDIKQHWTTTGLSEIGEKYRDGISHFINKA